jgi:hypothetical protein
MPTIAVSILEMLSTLLPYTLDPLVLNLLVLLFLLVLTITVMIVIICDCQGPVAYPGVLFGWGVQQIQLRRGQREWGSGSSSPLVKGSAQIANE